MNVKEYLEYIKKFKDLECRIQYVVEELLEINDNYITEIYDEMEQFTKKIEEKLKEK